MLKVGTRGSALALAQTQLVLDALRQRWPDLDTQVERITTTGDARRDTPLAALGRGAFVSEIETALHRREIDIAVHSAKDLPSQLAAGLVIGATLRRADPRDVVVSRHEGGLRDLPRAARVGTSSPRRACQIHALRPDLVVMEVRGNVDTRLRKLASGDFDALVLAAAGLVRLGRIDEATEWLDPTIMLPAVAQGAIAVELRESDAEVRAVVTPIDDPDTAAAVRAERAFLARLGAGCTAAVAAHATLGDSGTISVDGLIGAPDGGHVRGSRRGAVGDAVAIGDALATELLAGGGARFLGAVLA